ncbi:MAG: radical SAM family heme chaperone HemW [Candidatus Zixiibacteriota bacterium]
MSLSLYIHYPFCTNLCSYCDFYKIKCNETMEAAYFKALTSELALAADMIDSDDRTIETIYIGGGTPSLVNISLLERFLTELRKYFAIIANPEFTLEINPESIDADRLNTFREMGVTRPVFGIQSFNTRLLRLLGRKHNLEDSFRAIYLARALGFENFGIDMIFGLPRQTGRLLSDDLNQLIDLAPPHVSYYQLTVEHNTLLEKKIADGRLRLPADDLTAAMYLAINVELAQNDLHRYEVSSFARPGFECRHNMRYWEGGQYLGLGPSAHSFIDNRRFANKPDLKTYIEMISKGVRPLIFDSDTIESRMTEAVMLGLRTTRGIDRQGFRRRFDRPLENVIDMQHLNIYIQAGLIEADAEFIKLTETGFPLADEIIQKLIR